MYRYMKPVGDVLGALGVITCVVAGVARLMGHFHLVGTETISVYQGGIGLMVAACLLKLWALERGAAR